MTVDPSVQEPIAPAPAVPAAPAPEAEAPPWGTDFDPERAWKLVQDLRADKEKLAARPVLTPEQKSALAEHEKAVQAAKTNEQRLQEAATAAQTEAATARADVVRYKVAAAHGISSPEDLDLLGTGTEEELTARAVRIAALTAAQVAPPTVSAPGTRPVSQLRPGATPADVETPDEVLYNQLFGSQK